MKRLFVFKCVTRTLLAFFTGFLFQVNVSAAALKDAESASHADTAATQDMVTSYEYPGVKIIQFNLAVLSHYSYLVVSDKTALVVDPDRELDARDDKISFKVREASKEKVPYVLVVGAREEETGFDEPQGSVAPLIDVSFLLLIF